MKAMTHILLMGCLAAWIAGCGNGLDDRFPSAETPEELIGIVRKAMVAGDREAYIACVDIEGWAKDTLGAHFEAGHAIYEFDKRLREVFGDQAKEDLRDELGGRLGRGEAFARYVEVPLENCEFVQDGDKATCTWPNRAEITMVRTGGIWKVHIPGLSSGESLSSLPREEVGWRAAPPLEALTSISHTYRRLTTEVEKPGMTVKKLRESIVRRLTELDRKQDQLMMTLEGNP